jgi:hypothetical protein
MWGVRGKVQSAWRIGHGAERMAWKAGKDAERIGHSAERKARHQGPAQGPVMKRAVCSEKETNERRTLQGRTLSIERSTE